VIVEDQKDVITFLSRPESYGVDGPVERIDTHGAVVFLAGDRAYKLKRAVKFPYMDYSTAARRRAMCEAELAINRRTAPDHYLAVLPITREVGGFRLGGDGEAADWVVVMRRFDQAGLFDRLAAAGRLDAAVMRRLAGIIAHFHGRAEPRPDHGGRSETARVIDGLEQSFGEVASDFIAADIARVIDGLRAADERQGDLLDARREAGLVRHCHGDLHLRNICLIDGEPVLFDAIEFNDEIAVIDVLYDLSFLLMDLEHRGLRRFANIVLNGYLVGAGGHDGLALMPMFLAMRAAIRGLVTATAARSQVDPRLAAAQKGEAADYLRLAANFLVPPPPAMIAVGGFSGSGKTTLAYRLAPDLGRPPGAVVIRSDEVRKEIMGVDPLHRLGPEGYLPEVSARVYATLYRRAAVVLESGQAAICDGVFDRPQDRDAAETVARDAGAPFTGLWLDAPTDVIMRRADTRHGDASDATAAIVRRQLEHDPGTIGWRRIDASGPPDAVLGRAVHALRA
jgi:aminoglycoside phosphotransferase family enzyme/predicted kinase